MTTPQKLGPVEKISGAIRASHWHSAGSFIFYRRGVAWRGKARPGAARQARQARQAGRGSARLGKARLGRRGEARSGAARRG